MNFDVTRTAAPIPLRELGGTGLVTSALALGCARLGSTLTPLNRRQSLALLHEALDLGIRHFDTASIYGQGDSERYLGAAFQSRRAEVCLATKAGQRLSPLQAVAARFKGPIRWLARQRRTVRGAVARQRAGGVAYCFEPAYLLRSLEESLRRLRTDYVDLFYLHSPGPDTLADERLPRLAERLRRDGKIRGFGVSCDDPAAALAAASLPEVQVIQFDLDDDPTGAILATAGRNGKTVLVRGVARRLAGQGGGEDALGRAMHAALELPAVGGLIVGTTRTEHLWSNVRAFDLAVPSAAEPVLAPAYVMVGSRRMVWLEGDIPPGIALAEGGSP